MFDESYDFGIDYYLQALIEDIEDESNDFDSDYDLQALIEGIEDESNDFDSDYDLQALLEGIEDESNDFDIDEFIDDLDIDYDLQALIEGIEVVSPYLIYDEELYLQKYPDVAAAVAAGAFNSGLEHYILYGQAEGRSPGAFDEQAYLQQNPDVATAVEAGAFNSGLEHYILYGQAEGRSPGGFDDQAYLQQNPDVAAAVEAGAFSSGLEHYILYGRAEGREPLSTTASTTSSLQGTAARDLFVISGSNQAVISDGTMISEDAYSWIEAGGSYVGGGDADYALIQNFETGKDYIGLPGSPDYNLQTVNGSLNISIASGDLLAIVEGIPSLLPVAGIDGFSVEAPGLDVAYLG